MNEGFATYAEYLWPEAHEGRDAADVELDEWGERTEYGRVSHGRRAALGAVAELVKGRRDRAEGDVRERAEELLRDADFRVQSAALEALAVLGDLASLGALHALIDRELDGRLRRAREIVGDIGEGRGATAEVSALRDELAGFVRPCRYVPIGAARDDRVA